MSAPDVDDGHKFVLSLAGGGFRGLFTAEFLTLFENELGRPLHECLDLVVGTSVGAINAAGLAVGLEAASLRDMMVDLGRSVFPPERIPFSHLAKQILAQKRDPTLLAQALQQALGATTLLADTKVPVAIAAVDITGGRHKVFRDRRLGGRDDSTGLVDAVLASTAAPTYFPPHSIDAKTYADGGLFANAPDLIAATTALGDMRWRPDNITLVCVGATQSNDALASDEKTASLTGIDWGGLLLGQIMGAQVRFARESARKLVGEERYFMFDPVPGPRQEAVLGLDKADESAIKTLRGIAEDTFEEFLSAERNRRLLLALRNVRRNQ